MLTENNILTRIKELEYDIAHREELPQKPTHPNHPDELADSHILDQYKKDCDIFIKQIALYDKKLDEDYKLLKKQLLIWRGLVIELALSSKSPNPQNRKNLDQVFDKTIDTDELVNKIFSRENSCFLLLIEKRELFISKNLQ